jgi:competence protein ComEA
MERVDLGNDIGFRSSEINVEVEGAVVNPGMVKVSQGAVAADAIQAAGGFVPDANRDAVDVHQALSDGQRIVVPFEDGSSGQSQSAGSGGLMSINTAAKSDLETLPGIGEELAARIVDYRNRNGPFQKIEDIMLVDGIGQGKFDRIRRLITVGG